MRQKTEESKGLSTELLLTFRKKREIQLRRLKRGPGISSYRALGIQRKSVSR